MQRAVLRETAVRSIDAQNADTPSGQDSRGSLSAHVPAGRNSVDRDGAAVLNETSINALIQVSWRCVSRFADIYNSKNCLMYIR